MATKIILACLPDWWLKFLHLLFFHLNISSLSQLLHWFAWYCIQSILVMRLPVIVTSGLVLLCCRSMGVQLEAFKTSESHNFRVFIFLLNLKLCWLRKGRSCSHLLYVSWKPVCVLSLWADLFSVQMAIFCFVHSLPEVEIGFAGFLYNN